MVILRCICLLILTMFLMSSCGGGEEQGLDSHGEVIKDGYYPWIAEIKIPSELYAGEEFFYTMVIEAPLAPSVLNGQEQTGINIGRYPLYKDAEGKSVVASDVLIREIGETGPPRTEFISKAIFPEAGEHIIAILSAPTPELGGMPGKYETVGTPGPRTQGLIYREFPVTVLPAREQ